MFTIQRGKDGRLPLYPILAVWGWVNIYTLKSEGVITDVLKYQIYSNLRTASEGSLLDKDGVTCDKKKLFAHQDRHIRELAKKLP
jgi:hypothetical protein